MDGIDTKERDLDETLSRLITAYHILHAHHVLDEHGHIAVRNPQDSGTFFTSNLPAILISSKNDINHWNVNDGTPVKHPYEGCNVIVDQEFKNNGHTPNVVQERIQQNNYRAIAMSE
jgi:hypothetical protein